MVEPSNDQRPLVLLDGMSLAFRAFFALSTDIKTSEGLVTNALHGFASMLVSLIRSQEPRALCVAFHPGWVRTEMGGAGADIDASESIAGMRRALAELDSARNGSFLNYDGTTLAW